MVAGVYCGIPDNFFDVPTRSRNDESRGITNLHRFILRGVARDPHPNRITSLGNESQPRSQYRFRRHCRRVEPPSALLHRPSAWRTICRSCLPLERQGQSSPMRQTEPSFSRPSGNTTLHHEELSPSSRCVTSEGLGGFRVKLCNRGGCRFWKDEYFFGRTHLDLAPQVGERNFFYGN
jgi:hypothetical protein